MEIKNHNFANKNYKEKYPEICYNSDMSIGSFIKKRPYLLWYTRDYKHLSEEAALEAVLNYGYFGDVKKCLAILGIKRAAKIFRKQTERRRINYDPKILNYFDLYFRKHANL